MIQVSDLWKSYGGQPVLQRLHFEVKKGEFFGIIGPNGSGKSTLLKLLSAIESPDSGNIYLDGKPAVRIKPKELATWLAVLQQETLPPVGFTVREVVEMGRFPYQNWLGTEKDDAGAVIDEILSTLGLNALQDRTLDKLSGGEKQRVALAKVMAQQPRLLLLDEPTTFLDIGYQIQLLDAVHRWQRSENNTVVAVLHDLNLASLYCDRILLLDQGRQMGVGLPRQILQAEMIDKVYGVTPIVLEHPVHHLPQIMLQSRRE
ncbi:ABC transporter ATP-binding protein [Brevibacillus ruminantium]|uniref:ABC transporter ATP-binding protein n=1 Tax=Brevibacillus ruminantium TaxID=2950604 RepID=A0ABY4W846_9BACL|nr:ABC transporter ATP-binding protein [Brevibacillus ruminantium]USG63351.1 ABC transporter ATP-binding protein [Brevibacillus ruminantium]